MFKSLTHHELSTRQLLFILMIGFIAFVGINTFLFPFESPLSAAAPSDIGIFLIIGKGIEHGMVPYRDLFDIKGPLGFFITSIGYFLTPHSKLGQFIIANLWFYMNLPVLLHSLSNKKLPY